MATNFLNHSFNEQKGQPFYNRFKCDPSYDFAYLEILKQHAFLTKMVAIVSNDYFSYFNSSAVGFVPIDYPSVAIVNEDYPQAVPHELGHLFGISYELYPTNESPTAPTSVSVDGFNTRLGIEVPNATSIMGAAAALAGLDNKWIDPDSWASTLSYLQQVPTDPSIILVAGVLTQDGIFHQISTEHLAKGFLTADQKGDVVVQALDQSGRVLSQTSVKSSFYLRALSKAGAPTSSGFIKTDGFPLVVALPDNDELASVTIKRASGGTIASIQVQYTVLSLVQMLPLSSFRIFPSLSRSILLKEARDAQNLITARKNSEARAVLSAMTAEIALGVSDFKTSSINPLSKGEILDRISQIAKGLK